MELLAPMPSPQKQPLYGVLTVAMESLYSGYVEPSITRRTVCPEGQCLGPYRGPRGDMFLYERGTPVGSTEGRCVLAITPRMIPGLVQRKDLFDAVLFFMYFQDGHHVQGYLAHKKRHPPTVGQCLGLYGGHSRGALPAERGTPVSLSPHHDYL